MLQLRCVLFCTAVIILSACGSDDEPQSADSQAPVELLAGGGDTQLDANGVSSTDVQLDGAVTNMAQGADGSLWAVLAAETVINVADGEVKAWTPEPPAGATSIADLAVGSEDEIYLVFEGAKDSSVHTWAPQDGVSVAFGVPATAKQLAAAGPVSADGSAAADAALGEIADIAVDDDGHVIIAESQLPDGAGPVAASLVRTLDTNGDLVTLAGQPWNDPDVAPDADQIRTASFPQEGSAATSTDLLGPIAVATGTDGQLLVRTGWSVLTIKHDDVGIALGAVDGTEAIPAIDTDGPFSASAEATASDYRAILDPWSFAVNDDGDIVTGAMGNLEELDSDNQEPYLWDLADAGEAAQVIAGARTTYPDAHSAVLVTSDGHALTASLANDDTTWLDDATIAASTYDHESDQSIIVTLTAEEPED